MKPDRAEHTLTPKLRFPEFRKRSGWTETTLGAEGTFQKGRGVSKAEVDPSGKHSCIRYGELYTRYSEVIREIASRTSAPVDSFLLSRKNDVIIPSSGETKEDIATASCVLLDDVALGSDLNVIRTRHNGIFLSYFLNGPKRREIAKVAQGDTIVHLYASQLEELQIAFPDAAEQQKIADCLTSLDELIAAQGRKVEVLKAHKKGLTQRLFPREGETLPRLRFPEFRDEPPWEASSLASVGSMKAGQFVSASEIAGVQSSDSFPCYGGNGLRGYTKTFTHAGKYALIGRQGALCGNAFLVDGKFHATEHALVVAPNERIDVGWLYYILGFLKLNQYSIGQAQPGLSVSVLEKVPVAIPIDIHEQQQIADCLGSIDGQIVAETRKLDALRTHKKGLMQQLFPSPEGD